jgi:hypothetical protein
MSGPNLNLLNEMAQDILKMEMKYGMRKTMLRHVPEGAYFKRKPDAKKEYIRSHYNRKDAFGPATFTCTDSEDIGRCIQLKPETIVYVDA